MADFGGSERVSDLLKATQLLNGEARSWHWRWSPSSAKATHLSPLEISCLLPFSVSCEGGLKTVRFPQSLFKFCEDAARPGARDTGVPRPQISALHYTLFITQEDLEVMLSNPGPSSLSVPGSEFSRSCIDLLYLLAAVPSPLDPGIWAKYTAIQFWLNGTNSPFLLYNFGHSLRGFRRCHWLGITVLCYRMNFRTSLKRWALPLVLTQAALFPLQMPL